MAFVFVEFVLHRLRSPCTISSNDSDLKFKKSFEMAIDYFEMCKSTQKKNAIVYTMAFFFAAKNRYLL